MTYRYEGTEEVHLPTLGVTVSKGDLVESPVAINNDDFVIVPDATATNEPVIVVNESEVIEEPVTEVTN